MAKLDFQAKNLTADLTSAAVSGLIAIPDAIASALLAGVSPTYAFNALMTGTPIGSLFTGSQFINIGLTSAMMLAVADVLAGMDAGDTLTALFTLTLFIGVFQLILGLLKMGRFTRFISNTVMVGFLTGVAVVVILGQLGDLTGYKSGAGRTVTKAIDTLLHPGQWNLPSLAIGLATIILILLFNRTRLRTFSVALGMIITSVVVILGSAAGLPGLDSVALIGDTNQISGSIPMPTLPDLSLIPSLALSAVAIGLIGLIQGSGVSQGVPNPDGEYPDASRDFLGQGIANIVSGSFQGLPLGGSVGGTGIVMSTGAKSRWANVFLGLFVGIFVLLFSGLVEAVAMPAVAGVLIVVGFGIINRESIADVWDVHVSKRVIMLVTFFATLILPVQQAILLGVFLSLIDYIYSSSAHVNLIALRPLDSGTFREETAPAILPDDSVTVLQARGSTYFAAARTIQDLLPEAKESQQAVVIMRMRGIDQIGTTFISVMERYAAELRANGGRLMLSGVGEKVKAQLLRTETTDSIPEDGIFMATEVLGDSTRAAMAAGEMWLATEHNGPDSISREEVEGVA
ncbi:MAG: SulP family inorganic anion transporter [Chloroflexota bacterium]|nr:SulP family inorganic anion transporter [Chloroflexota bacterium]